jgi:hypothetical protein
MRGTPAYDHPHATVRINRPQKEPDMNPPTGYIIVQSRRANTRRYDSVHNPGKRHGPTWTLHRADCFYIQRTVTAITIPAPAKPYPGTVPCQACKPDIKDPA